MASYLGNGCLADALEIAYNSKGKYKYIAMDIDTRDFILSDKRDMVELIAERNYFADFYFFDISELRTKDDLANFYDSI